MYHKIILEKILEVYHSGIEQDWVGEESKLFIRIVKDYGDGTKYMRYEYCDPFYDEFKHIIVHSFFTERGTNNKLITVFEPEILCKQSGEYYNASGGEEFKFVSKKIPHMRLLQDGEKEPSLPQRDRRKNKV